jgi:hypothetical protein
MANSYSLIGEATDTTPIYANDLMQEVRISSVSRCSGSTCGWVAAETANLLTPTSFVSQGSWTAPACSITTSSLPNGVTGAAYAATMAGNSCPSVSWSVAAGSLPAGLTLNSATGVITGTPSAAGTSSFTIEAASTNDKNGLTAARTDFESVIQSGGPHAEEAQKHLLDINNKLAALNQPVVSEPKPAVKPKIPAVVTVDNDAAVRAVIQKYVQAFDQKDADALRQIWPNMGPLYARYKRAFEGASSIREQLDIESIDLSPDGTKAVVKGQITQDFTPKGDKTKRVKNATVFHLAKSNSGTWVITDVQ